MVEKIFELKGNEYIHIPVHGRSPRKEGYYYVEILAGEQKRTEIYIAVTPPEKPFDFYVPFKANRYGTESITLICRDENAPKNLFDGIKLGGRLFDEPELYPDLYKEEIRQQLHFSPARGWTNDANGLFYKDGKFNLYFQHAPFGNHHNGTNISWGHAITEDGVHYKEYDDAILVRAWDKHIASGSAIVDEYNISGIGKGTILAAYTDLSSFAYCGRERVINGVCQQLLYSTDDGMTFNYFDFNPILKAPDGEMWRDPKLLQIDENTIAIAVYETYEGQNCISFYKTHNCKDWEFCSRIMNFYECPDIFKLKVENEDREVWVVYGGNGRYSIGEFEDFQFKEISPSGLLDYGSAVYAGQTYNNYDSKEKRMFTGWIGEIGHRTFHNDSPLNKYGFSHSMSIMSELTVHKTALGYRLFRKPVEEFKKLRKSCREHVGLNYHTEYKAQTETVFTLRHDMDATVLAADLGFKYIAKDNKIITTSFKEYTFADRKDIEVRIIADRRSIEMFLNNEIVLTFSAQPVSLQILNDYYKIWGTIYELESIWDK